tara:strand:- start:47 stop:223 length:177 start_codon:yes stop_codon:yes gene_type:complete
LKPIGFGSKVKQDKLLDSKGCFAVSCLIFLQLVSGNNAVKFAKLREPGQFILFVYWVD